MTDILSQRAKEAFYPGALDDSVIPFVAAISAQDSGDARKALDLLRIAADVAERNGDKKVIEAHVDYARKKIEIDASTEIVKSLTMQSKLVLLSIIKNPNDSEGQITTGDVYIVYRKYASRLGVQPLTQRRVGDLISELDMLGIINARVRSLGRKGRTKIITLNISKEIADIVVDDEMFRDLNLQKLATQKTLEQL